MNTSKDIESLIEFKHLKIINKLLADTGKVEIVLTKDGVKIFKISRKEIKE